MRMIRKGEYDLVNISLIGHDPKTGRSFEDCYTEWETEREKVLQDWGQLRWWQVVKSIKCRWRMIILTRRFSSDQ